MYTLFNRIMEFSWTDEDIITGDKFLELSSKYSEIAFIRPDTLYLQSPVEWRGKLHSMRPARIWITGQTDLPITKEVFDHYHHNTHIWFTSNKDHIDDKLISIPLGITNNTNESSDHPIYGNTKIMLEVAKIPKTIRGLVYMNFLLHTYPPERGLCYELFSNKPWVTVGTPKKTLEARKQFLTDIRNHLFVLCPRGNGVDTHRVWETLYMGSIPIVKKHVTMNDFTDLPILFIDDWDIITEDFLLEQYKRIKATSWNMEKMKMSYWYKHITSYIT
jgi:hypothetical protein